MKMYYRCNLNFCQNKYTVISAEKKLEDPTCDYCGNNYEVVSKKDAMKYFESQKNKIDKVEVNRFEKLGKSTKLVKDKISMENVGRVVGSVINSNKSKKKTSEMSKQELINELEDTKYRSLSPKQLLGGCIGIIGYIIVKAVTVYGWHYGDIIGLVLLAFLPGAIFIGGMLEDK